MNEFDTESEYIDIYDWTFYCVEIEKVIKWLKARQYKGHKFISLNFEWGHYDEITSIEIKSKVK